MEELGIRSNLAFCHSCKGFTADLCCRRALGLQGGRQGLHQGAALDLGLCLQYHFAFASGQVRLCSYQGCGRGCLCLLAVLGPVTFCDSHHVIYKLNLHDPCCNLALSDLCLLGYHPTHAHPVLARCHLCFFKKQVKRAEKNAAFNLCCSCQLQSTLTPIQHPYWLCTQP